MSRVSGNCVSRGPPAPWCEFWRKDLLILAYDLAPNYVHMRLSENELNTTRSPPLTFTRLSNSSHGFQFTPFFFHSLKKPHKQRSACIKDMLLNNDFTFELT